jgi:F-type H+-transporting ATPase subunit a
MRLTTILLAIFLISTLSFCGISAPPSHEEPTSEHGITVESTLEHHLCDATFVEFLGMKIHLPVLFYWHSTPIPLTKHMVFWGVAGLLLLWMGLANARKVGGIPKGFANLLEVFIVFLRDEVVYPAMGEEIGRKWLPFFLTTFFFILFANLLGMVPWGVTPTGDISMTGGMALIVLILMFVSGIVYNGPIGFLKSFLPPGVPFFVLPILFVIEIMGLFVKAFALCMRLFANMLAGHAVIAVFMVLITSLLIAPISILGVVAISMLEIFVAFLQAYIFTILSAIFIGMMIHPSH